MGKEIEAKFAVADFRAIRRRLRQIGAEFLHTLRVTDTYYDTAARSMLNRDCGLRIRNIRCLRAGAQPIKMHAVITAKGPRLGDKGGAAKTREEIEIPLEDAKASASLIETLGLEATITIEKRRSVYRLGRCKIELDELPVIGRFVEIEAPSSAQVTKTAAELLLPAEPITDHYVNLITTACKKLNRQCRTVTFDTIRPSSRRGRSME